MVSLGIAPRARTPRVRRVLLVDDQELLLRCLDREFTREGVTVRHATTAAEAEQRARDEAPDLAIVDLFLAPPESGIDVIRRLKAIDPAIFCVLVSAHMSVAHALTAVRAGADDVYFKPFSARQALRRVEEGVFASPEGSTPTLDQVEWEHIARALEDYRGNISRAADALGVYRQSLQRKIQRHAPRALRPVSSRPAPKRSKRKKPRRR